MFVSVTRIRLRTPLFLPAFLWQSYKLIAQAKKSAGNMGVRFRKTKGITFWTLTGWKDEAAVKIFRNAMPHRGAMSRLMFWCDEASFAHWDQAEGELPAWDAAAQKLLAQGVFSKLNYPSENQKAGHISID